MGNNVDRLIQNQKRSFKHGIRTRLEDTGISSDVLLFKFFKDRANLATQIHENMDKYESIHKFQAFNYLILHASQANQSGSEKQVDFQRKDYRYLIRTALSWAVLRHNAVKLTRNISKPYHPTFPATEATKRKILQLGFVGDDVYNMKYQPDSSLPAEIRSEIVELKEEIIGSYYFTSVPEINQMLRFLAKKEEWTQAELLKRLEVLQHFFTTPQFSGDKAIIFDDEMYGELVNSEFIDWDFAQEIGESSPAPFCYHLTRGDYLIDIGLIDLLLRFARYNTKEYKKIRANSFEKIIRSIGKAADWEVEDFNEEFPRLEKDIKEDQNPNVTEVDVVLKRGNNHILIESKNWGIWSFHFLGTEDTSRFEMLKGSAEKMDFRRRLYAERNNLDPKTISLLIVSSINEEWESIMNIPIISVDNLLTYLTEK